MLTLQGGDSLVGGLPIIHITYQQYIANPSAYHDPDVIVHISGFPTAGNMPADYVGYDSNLNMEDIGNIATKAIAKVEPSDTALYLHEVGTGFINKDGNYCITDVQISVGGTITLGTNCHVVDGGIGGRLADLGNCTLLAEFTNTTATNVTLPDNINNYREVLLCRGTTTSTAIDSTSILPVSVFKNTVCLRAKDNHVAGGSDRSFRVIASYVNDTTVSVETYTDYSDITVKGYLYGIK